MSSQHSSSFPPALSTSLALTLGAFSTLAVAQTAAAPASPLDTVEVRSTREAPAYQPAAVQSPSSPSRCATRRKASAWCRPS